MPNQPPDSPEPPRHPDPPQVPAGQPLPKHVGILLHATRILLRFGIHLRHTIRQRATAPSFDAIAVNFGTASLTVILAHLSRGLLRALALQHVLRAYAAAGRDVALFDHDPPRAPSAAPPPPAATPDNPSPDAPPAAVPRQSTPRPPVPDGDAGFAMPTMAEAIAQVRRRPFGRTIADICLDLGVIPGFCTAPVWNILFECMHYFGGNLDTIRRERERRYQTFSKEWDRRPSITPNPPIFNWWTLGKDTARQVLGFFIGEDPVNPFAPPPAMHPAGHPAGHQAVATGPP